MPLQEQLQTSFYNLLKLDTSLKENQKLIQKMKRKHKLPRAYAHVTSSQAVLRTAGYYIATLRAPFGRKLTSPR